MSVACLNAKFLSLTTYNNELQHQLSTLMSRRQYLTNQSVSIANQKSAAFQSDDKNKISQMEAIETSIQSMDKFLEMDTKKIETQQKMASTELESVQKTLDTNIKSSFKSNA